MKNLNALSKLIKKYKSIETIKDLKQNKLTLSDYQLLFDILKDIQSTGQAETIFLNVKNWIVKNGGKATQNIENNNISWILTI